MSPEELEGQETAEEIEEKKSRIRALKDERNRLREENAEFRSRIDGIEGRLGDIVSMIKQGQAPGTAKNGSGWDGLDESELLRIAMGGETETPMVAKSLVEWAKKHVRAEIDRAREENRRETNEANQNWTREQQVTNRIVSEFGNDVRDKNSDLYREGDRIYRAYLREFGENKVRSDPIYKYFAMREANDNLKRTTTQGMSETPSPSKKPGPGPENMVSGGDRADAAKSLAEKKANLLKKDWRKALRVGHEAMFPKDERYF